MRMQAKKARLSVIRILTFGMVLQATGCSFDSQTFLSTSLESWLNTISSLFILNTLSDLLNVNSSFFF